MLEKAILANIVEEIYDIRVVSVSHNPRIWYFVLQKISGPDSIPGFPRVNVVSHKAVDKYEASIECISLRKLSVVERLVLSLNRPYSRN